MLNKIKSFFKYIINPDYRKHVKVKKKQKKIDEIFRKYKDLDDAEYLKILYKVRMGKKLNLDNPKTFNEKLQWLKLYNRKPIYTTMVDKYAVKNYVADKIGEEFVIPLYGVWDRFEDIDFNVLPNQFVLKTTHNSGGIIVCKDKSLLDKDKAKVKIEKWLQGDSFLAKREWPYKDVPHRIIAEKYMVDESGYELKDYKFFCFNGQAKTVLIMSNRFNPLEELTWDMFDTATFENLHIVHGHPNSQTEVKKPKNFHKMIELAEILSKDIPFIRVDFYEVYGKIYFGELTFFDASGLTPFQPEKWDYIMGGWIDLSGVNKIQ